MLQVLERCIKSDIFDISLYKISFSDILWLEVNDSNHRGESMFIAYDTKNGIEYGKLVTSKRVNGKVSKDYINLGRVLDKDKGIFQNRERGVFIYDSSTNSFRKAPQDFVPQVQNRNKKTQLILDFGDAFFLNDFIKKSNLNPAIDAVGYGNPDTLYAMLHYYILCNMANCHAESWWEGSYARTLFPKANLTSQRISDFLTSIGSEHSQRSFFKEYFKVLDNTGVDVSNALIDSTGLPNSIRFPLSAVVSRNGEINNEVRLIYVVQQKTGMPIYFRYCAGNIVDSTTLTRCMAELKAQGVDINFAILDAGYYTDDNLSDMFDKKVSFVTRMKANRIEYKQLIEEHFDTLQAKENLIEYNGRYVYLKCVRIKLSDHSAYAYLGLDIERKSMESSKTFRTAKGRKLKIGQVFEAIQKQGVFVLISSRKIAASKILPLYYTRQQIEQVFDIGKNYAEMLPIRVHNEDTFRGHLVLTFLATVVIKQLQNHLLDTPITPISLFFDLRNHKCKVFEDKIITYEAFKKANDIYKLFKIKVPVDIKL